MQDLLAEGTVTRDTVLYLVNSIYFAASWNKEFMEEDDIQNAKFHVSNSKTEKVKQLFKTKSTTFTEANEAHFFF